MNKALQHPLKQSHEPEQKQRQKKWAMVADLSRCVGCQTCTSACKHTNATAPGVQWRKVLDFEVGEFPEVARAFVPVGCMHCENPPCLDVCPSGATKKRDDGVVTIDYDICIGCAYCALACPYQARSRVDTPNAAYGGKSMRHEIASEAWERRGVAQKCTFCVDRIDFGLANDLTPGLDHEATPACVNSCIADALHFGDVNDPTSNVSKLLAQNKHFTMHDDIGTGPNIHYLWDRGSDDKNSVEPPQMMAEPVGLDSVSPQLQKSWDWRAAANFIFGGTGTGLFAMTALASLFVVPEIAFPYFPVGSPALIGMALLALTIVGLGLFCVWLEIGRPWRFLNVFLRPGLSWMTREAMAAMVFFPLAVVALFIGSSGMWLAAGAVGLAFLYCQARILKAAKGIPAWRQDEIVELILATGLTEGVALFGFIGAVLKFSGVGLDVALLSIIPIVLSALVILRYLFWRRYRKALGRVGAPTNTFEALDGSIFDLSFKSQFVVLIIVASSILIPALLIPGGLIALLCGWGFKYGLITRAAYNQGYAIGRMPVRGSGDSKAGIKPAWTVS